MIFFCQRAQTQEKRLSFAIKCLLFGHENTPQDIPSNKRGVVSYFDL